MSDSNRLNLVYAKETGGFGVTPSTGAVPMRITGEDLRQNTNGEESAELRSDRQVAEWQRLGINAEGNTNIELPYGAHDDLLRSALFADNDWTAQVSIAASVAVTVAASGNTFTIDTGTWDNTPAVNSWIQVTGATDPANNGVFKVTASTTSVITVAGGTLVDETSATLTIDQGSEITNGVLLETYALQKEYTDLSNEFALYSGMGVNELNLQIARRSYITGRFGWMGIREESGASNVLGTPVSDNTSLPMQTTDHIQGVLENNSVIGATELNFTANNNLRDRSELGQLGPGELGTGRFQVTGTFTGFYKSNTLIDKYLNNTASSLAIKTKDPAGNWYVFDWPKVRFSTGSRNSSGRDTDILVPLDFQAVRNADEDITMRIVRFPAA